MIDLLTSLVAKKKSYSIPYQMILGKKNGKVFVTYATEIISLYLIKLCFLLPSKRKITNSQDSTQYRLAQQKCCTSQHENYFTTKRLKLSRVIERVFLCMFLLCFTSFFYCLQKKKPQHKVCGILIEANHLRWKIVKKKIPCTHTKKVLLEKFWQDIRRKYKLKEFLVSLMGIDCKIYYSTEINNIDFYYEGKICTRKLKFVRNRTRKFVYILIKNSEPRKSENTKFKGKLIKVR